MFLHPASTGGAEGPDDWRLGKYDMSIMLGYAYEETLAVATLIIGGVLDRHPDLDICISHGGGAMPYLIERFSEMSEFRDWAPEGVKKNGFVNELKRLWFDAHVHGEKSQKMLFDLIVASSLFTCKNEISFSLILYVLTLATAVKLFFIISNNLTPYSNLSALKR